MNRIGLIDYGAGNFRSVRNALDYLQLDVIEVRSARECHEATCLVLPGVGAFASAMRRLEEMDLIEALQHDVIESGKPFLGICVGMQLLAETGTEFDTSAGLGWISGSIQKVRSGALPLPHVGWNDLTLRKDSPLFEDLETSEMYFVHSYQFAAHVDDSVSATCEYGETVTAAIESRNIFGVQFHPEKSQRDGLQLLRNFAGLRA